MFWIRPLSRGAGTTLTVWDLWTNPVGVAALLDVWGEKLGGPRAGVWDPVRAHARDGVDTTTTPPPPQCSTMETHWTLGGDNANSITITRVTLLKDKDRQTRLGYIRQYPHNWGWPDLPQLCGSLMTSMKFDWHKKRLCWSIGILQGAWPCSPQPQS